VKCPRCAENTELKAIELIQGKGEIFLCRPCLTDWVVFRKVFTDAKHNIGSAPTNSEKSFAVDKFLFAPPGEADRFEFARASSLAAFFLSCDVLPPKHIFAPVHPNQRPAYDSDYAWAAGVLDALSSRNAISIMVEEPVRATFKSLIGVEPAWSGIPREVLAKVQPFLTCHSEYAKAIVTMDLAAQMEPCTWHPDTVAKCENDYAYAAGIFDVLGSVHKTPETTRAAIIKCPCRFLPCLFEALFGGDVSEVDGLLCWEAPGKDFARRARMHMASTLSRDLVEAKKAPEPDEPAKPILPPSQPLAPKVDPVSITLDGVVIEAAQKNAGSCFLCRRVLDTPDGVLQNDSMMSALAKARHIRTCLGMVIEAACPICSKTSVVHEWESLEECASCSKKGESRG